MSRRLGVLVLLVAFCRAEVCAGGPLKVGVFAGDASPPIGSPMAYDPTKEVLLPLSCRGVVLVGEGEPVVLCAVDWIGIGNDGQAANDLAWLRRCKAGETIDVACLRPGPARVLHLPGELFVEYQLAAQALKPGRLVAMAAYGDYGPGYIGTEAAYSQGGYETSPTASLVAPGVERLLMDAIARLLRD